MINSGISSVHRSVGIIISVMMRMMIMIPVVPIPVIPVPVVPIPAASAVIPRIIWIPERIIIAIITVIAIVIRISERDYRNIDYAGRCSGGRPAVFVIFDIYLIVELSPRRIGQSILFV